MHLMQCFADRERLHQILLSLVWSANREMSDMQKEGKPIYLSVLRVYRTVR